MQNLDHELTNFGKACYYPTVNFSHSYWQLTFANGTQECQSFITLYGIFTLTRVMQGTTNAVTKFQFLIAGIISNDMKRHILIWLDDVLLYVRTVEELFESVQSFSALCVKYSLKPHPAKCTILTTKIRSCGGVVAAKSMRYDPCRVDGLLSVAPPTTWSSLQQFVCALRWVNQGIYDLSRLITTLHKFMIRGYDHMYSFTKYAVSRVQLVTLEWGSAELDASKAYKKALSGQVTPTHRDVNQTLCVYTNASDTA